MNLPQIQARYAATAVEIEVPSLLIRIDKLCRHTMSALELYDAMRIAWKLGRDREKVKYALATMRLSKLLPPHLLRGSTEPEAMTTA